MDNKPYISVLIPLLNEQDSLTELQQRLHDALEGIGKPYEILYINDGSTDNTQRILEDFHERFPTVKVIEFNKNYGQHKKAMRASVKYVGPFLPVLGFFLFYLLS